MIVILGGGLTGLSCAYHLNEEYILVEKNDTLGGLARSFLKDGFSFDITGHLLHFNNPDIHSFVADELGLKLLKHKRAAMIHIANKLIPYPFQLNLHALSAEIKNECLQGLNEIKSPNSDYEYKHFLDWCEKSFGRGITKYFMKPYNEKLWCTSLLELTCEWMGRYIPTPDKNEMLSSVTKPPGGDIGYNAFFYYPQKFGIGSLADGFSKNVFCVELNKSVKKISLSKQEIYLSDNHKIKFSRIVSTIPLPLLLDAMKEELPSDIYDLRASLKWTSVYNLNIGVKHTPLNNAMWVYYPEPGFPFYRIGCYTNIDSSLSPPGCSGYYIECSYRQNIPNFYELKKKIISACKSHGIINNDDEIITSQENNIEYAYVIYDSQRTSTVDKITEYLAQKNIFLAGRYGKWEYGTMESAITDGKNIAEKLK